MSGATSRPRPENPFHNFPESAEHEAAIVLALYGGGIGKKTAGRPKTDPDTSGGGCCGLGLGSLAAVHRFDELAAMVFDDVPPDFLRRRDFSGFERELAGQQCEFANRLMRRKAPRPPLDFAFVNRRHLGLPHPIPAAPPLH